MKVTIIVPVYSDVNTTKLTIESVISNTDLSNDCQLLLINDASPDKEIDTLLATYQNQPHMIIFKNTDNLGFSGTINRGIQFSDGDVVILNADVVVTENWLKHLMEVAYSNVSFGSVTALTNSGTIASVPHFNHDSALPLGYDTQAFADLIEITRKLHRLKKVSLFPQGWGIVCLSKGKSLIQLACLMPKLSVRVMVKKTILVKGWLPLIIRIWWP